MFALLTVDEEEESNWTTVMNGARPQAVRGTKAATHTHANRFCAFGCNCHEEPAARPVLRVVLCKVAQVWLRHERVSSSHQ